MSGAGAAAGAGEDTKGSLMVMTRKTWGLGRVAIDYLEIEIFWTEILCGHDDPEKATVLPSERQMSEKRHKMQKRKA